MFCCFVGFFLTKQQDCILKNCFFFLGSYACVCINMAESLKTIHLHSQFESKKMIVTIHPEENL
jgi:hypothetical protein